MRAVDAAGLTNKSLSAAALAEEILQRERSLLSTATMAKVALGTQFIPELGKALYEHPDDAHSNAPGPLARGVGRLVRAFRTHPHHEIHVITTNYDDYLEQALKAEGVKRVKPQFTNTGMRDPRDFGVRHAHGLLLPTGKSQGTVVLTEADYYTTDSSSWQEQFFRDRLSDSFVLFVGASLTDLNLLRILFRYASEPGRLHAVLPRSPDETRSPDVLEPRNAIASAHDTLGLRRWRSRGLNVLFADHYSQPSQFVFEVAQRKLDGNAYVPYGDRLDAWYRQVATSTLGLRSQKAFATAQSEVRERSRTFLEQVIPSTGLAMRRGEVLALHTWVRVPGDLRIGPIKRGPVNVDSLAMLMCSDREWRDPRAADSKVVMMPTARAAVEAFCFGTPRIHEQATAAHQWNFVLAVPVALDQPDGRLPVGAVTINSNLAGGRSCLARLRSSNWEGFTALAQYLQEWGAAILNPTLA